MGTFGVLYLSYLKALSGGGGGSSVQTQTRGCPQHVMMDPSSPPAGWEHFQEPVWKNTRACRHVNTCSVLHLVELRPMFAKMWIFFSSLLSLLGHFFPRKDDGRQMLRKHQRTFLISVLDSSQGQHECTEDMVVIAYSVPGRQEFQSATGLYLSAGIFYMQTPSAGLRISPSIRCFSLICCNILYPDETGNGALT